MCAFALCLKLPVTSVRAPVFNSLTITPSKPPAVSFGFDAQILFGDRPFSSHVAFAPKNSWRRSWQLRRTNSVESPAVHQNITIISGFEHERAGRRMDYLREEIASIDEELNMLAREERALERKGLQRSGVIARKKSALADRNDYILQLQECEAGLERMMCRSALRSKIADLEKQIEKMEQERETLEKHRLDTSDLVRRQDAARAEIDEIGRKLQEEEDDAPRKKKTRRWDVLENQIAEVREEIRGLEKEVDYLTRMGYQNSNKAVQLRDASKRLTDLVEELGEAKSGVKRAHSKPKMRQMLVEVEERIEGVRKEQQTLSKYGLDITHFVNQERRLIQQRAELLQQLEQEPDPLALAPHQDDSGVGSDEKPLINLAQEVRQHSVVDVPPREPLPEDLGEVEEVFPLHFPTKQERSEVAHATDVITVTAEGSPARPPPAPTAATMHPPPIPQAQAQPRGPQTHSQTERFATRDVFARVVSPSPSPSSRSPSPPPSSSDNQRLLSSYIRLALKSPEWKLDLARIKQTLILTAGIVDAASIPQLVSDLVAELPGVQGVMPTSSGNVLVLFKDPEPCLAFLSAGAFAWGELSLAIVDPANPDLPSASSSSASKESRCRTVLRVVQVPFDIDTEEVSRAVGRVCGDVGSCEREVFPGTDAWNGNVRVELPRPVPDTSAGVVLDGRKYRIEVVEQVLATPPPVVRLPRLPRRKEGTSAGGTVPDPAPTTAAAKGVVREGKEEAPTRSATANGNGVGGDAVRRVRKPAAKRRVQAPGVE